MYRSIETESMYQFFTKACRFKTGYRMLRFLIGLIFLFGILNFCQSSTEIRGKVINKETGEPIIGAVVKIKANGQVLNETTTAKDGSFQFTQNVQEDQQIHVSSIGYALYRKTLVLTPDSPYYLEIALSDQIFELAPIEIIGQSVRQHKKLTGTMSKLEPQAVDLIKPVGTQELLEFVPGINGYADDGFGNSRLSIGIRGLNPRRSARVLILEDGVPIQPAVYIYPNAYYNPPADRIDAVEVIKSSAAVRYGPQTMGGVINYTTRKPDGTRGFGNQIAVGNNGYYSAFSELRGIGNPEKVSSDLQLLYKHGDGFRDNNTFDQANGTLKTLFQLSAEKTLYLKLNGNYENSNATYTGLTEYTFETDPNFNPKEDDNFKILRTSLDLIYTNKITENLVSNTTMYTSLFDRRWWREDDIFVRPASLDTGNLVPVPYYQTGDLVRTGGGETNFGILRTFYVGGLEQNYTVKHGIGGNAGRAEIGGRVHWERFIDDRKIGDAPDARDGVYYTGTSGSTEDPVKIVGQSHHYETMALALYAKEQLELQNLTLTLGTRFEVFKQDRVDRLRGSVLADKVSSVLLPGIGVNYQIGQFNLFGGIHRGYTAPSSGALKITNFGQNVEAGGLDLEPEKSWNLELGFRSWMRGVTIETAGFFIGVEDLVAAGRGTAFKNLGKVNLSGLEMAVGLGISEFVSILPDLNASYTYLQTEIVDGVVKSATIAGNVDVELNGNELPYAPQHTFTVGLAKHFGDVLRMRADMRFVDEVFTDFENIQQTKNRGDTGPIPSYAIVNASINYKLTTQWQLFFTAKNIFDKVYIGSRLHSNAGQPEANLSSGILIGPRRQILFGIKQGL
ncbi:TonB-dependent receptor [Candidatus Poribacteria bacterium]|nr:MAG: TonB-dependent receptor [Candidatus Poribacteria bacterium]